MVTINCNYYNMIDYLRAVLATFFLNILVSRYTGKTDTKGKRIIYKLLLLDLLFFILRAGTASSI